MSDNTIEVPTRGFAELRNGTVNMKAIVAAIDPTWFSGKPACLLQVRTGRGNIASGSIILPLDDMLTFARSLLTQYAVASVPTNSGNQQDTNAVIDEYHSYEDGSLSVQVDGDLYIGYWFDTDNLTNAQECAQAYEMDIYTEHDENYVQRGIHFVNRYRYWVLPKELPDYMEMAESEEES